MVQTPEQNKKQNNQKNNSKTEKSFSNPHIRDEHVLISIGMAPLRGLQRSYRHLSSVKGFGIVASLMTCYCAGLSIEAIFIATPTALRQGNYTEEVRRNRRFIPKPYVDDGASLGRLSPIPNIQRAVLQRYFQWLPYWIRGRTENPYWTVWNEPAILSLSVVIALVIQRFEGMIWRKKSPKQTKAEFWQANNQKRVQASADAIALAAYKAQQHNTQGMGGILGTFFAVVCLYGLEIAAFAGSFAGGAGWVVNAIYAALTIGGFEIFDRMSEDSQGEKV